MPRYIHTLISRDIFHGTLTYYTRLCIARTKKLVCSSAYQMLSPSLFVCQLNATSAATEPLGFSSAYHSPTLSLPKPIAPSAWQFIPCISYAPFSRSQALRSSAALFLSLFSSVYIICFHPATSHSFTRISLDRQTRDNGVWTNKRRRIIFFSHSAQSLVP